MMCANHPDRERVAFCQNCGKPLCQECTRIIGPAVFCEVCLAEKIGSATPPPAPGNPWVGPIPPPPVADPGAPNPGLAALLGFIPGVGAMYNGQFAKGIVHLAIFAVLTQMVKVVEIFGLFVAGWVFYMVFEAYQTAKARRDGLPLPNPFGLNEIGEKFGFGKAWPSSNATGPDTSIPVDPVVPPVPPPPPVGGYGPPYSYTPPPPPPAYPYSVPPVPPVDPTWQPQPRNRFPVGAIWLIGLGALFLIGNSHIPFFRIHNLWPLIVIAVGVWSFISRMQETGLYLSNDGSALYRWRVINAMRRAGWLLMVGVIGLCNTLLGISWHTLWPFFLIYLGLWAIIERSAWSQATADMYYPTPAPTTPAGTSLIPADRQEESK